ncbi:hypothetical protein MBLNU457_1287t1 [Dothideomycetes sp. NU457]
MRSSTLLLFLISVLALASTIRSAATSYTIQGIDIGPSNCNTDVTAGSIVNIRWALDNATAAVGDTCYLAIRSFGDTVDDDAYVVDKHVPCDFTSTNIVIPTVAHDSSLLFNGSNCFVRINVPSTGHGMLDSCPFRLQP